MGWDIFVRIILADREYDGRMYGPARRIRVRKRMPSSGTGPRRISEKNGLSVEQPIAGDELRAIKRYLSTRTDNLPWLLYPSATASCKPSAGVSCYARGPSSGLATYAATFLRLLPGESWL
jgi:hypothetical protein